MRIIVCGLNGAGKSTLGKALAKRLYYEFRDIEDYYFPKTDDKYEYSIQRTEEEVAVLLLKDLEENDDVVLASVRGNYSEQIKKLFDLAVYIDIPKEIRMARVRKRSNDKFGNRIACWVYARVMNKLVRKAFEICNCYMLQGMNPKYAI